MTLQSFQNKSTNDHQSRLHPTIWMVGVMMFLMNLSYLMVYSYTGIYLKTILGVGTLAIGFFEGTAEALSFFMKLFSGVISDHWQRRKPLILLGYFFSVGSRVMFGVFNTFLPIFSARMLERIGNGIQSTPRDTIVADLAPPNRIGSAYGLKRTLSQAGAIFGCILGFFVMEWTQSDFQKVFLISSFPAILAFLILILFVKEPQKTSIDKKNTQSSPNKKNFLGISWANFPLLGNRFWVLMGISAIFMLSRYNETFLILYAHNSFALEPKYASMIMLVFNTAWCISSYPIGFLGDRLNRYWFLALGIIFLIVANFFLATATNLSMMLVGVACWGVQYGATQNVLTSLVAEVVPERLRGTGLGCFYIICATCLFFADNIFATLDHHFSTYHYGFLLSGVLGCTSLAALVIIIGKKKKAI
jgi:MFS family permease